MTYSAQSLLADVLSISTAGLIDPAVSFTDVSFSDDKVVGSYSREGVALTAEVSVDGVEGLLNLIASSLNNQPQPKQKSAQPKAKAKPEPKSAPAPAVVPEVDDAAGGVEEDASDADDLF